MHQNLLEKHLELVIEANKTTNITRISSWEDGMLLHVKDSLLGLDALNACPDGKYADIGTGAGYPGIPLAIETGRETLLVDSVSKKVRILDTFIEELGLDNVTTYAGRIEDLGKERRGQFAAVSARALSRLSVLLELASPLLMRGGRLICFKANVDSDELEHADVVAKQVGMKLVDDQLFELNEYQRRILSYEKIAESKIKLPRHVGFAQKKPL
jgi:16S rRNA (guanine527-N7)-methyltransferase